jgi:6-phosphogluconolactonase
MKTKYLRFAVFSPLILLGASCGGGSSTSSTKVNPLPACTPASPPPHAYVLNGLSADTVSMYTVDSCTGKLTATTPATVSTGGNEFGAEEMAVDPAGRFVYVANLMSNATDLATIAMYTLDSSTGILIPTNPPTVPTGFFPQGIAINPSGKFVYTANSDDNTVSMFAINQATGILTPTTPPTVATGWSPLSVTVDPSGRFAYAANQDDDTVSMYTINASTGVLTPTTPATVPTGFSPFGVTVDPSGKFAYVPNAYDSRNIVSQYAIDSTTGVLTPNAQDAAAGNQPTWVAVDPSSKFAYVVNRGDSTVSAYTINSITGALTPNGTLATGQEPFRIAIDPSGSFAYVVNESGSVSIYTLGSKGTLSAAGSEETSRPLSVAVVETKH